MKANELTKGMDMGLVMPSRRFVGRYIVGGHELVSGDLIEFENGAQIVKGLIVFQTSGYFVEVQDGTLVPLREIITARYVGRWKHY